MTRQCLAAKDLKCILWIEEYKHFHLTFAQFFGLHAYHSVDKVFEHLKLLALSVDSRQCPNGTRAWFVDEQPHQLVG